MTSSCSPRSRVNPEGPKVEEVKIIEQGRAIGVLLREWDGTISAIRIPIEQLAD